MEVQEKKAEDLFPMPKIQPVSQNPFVEAADALGDNSSNKKQPRQRQPSARFAAHDVDQSPRSSVGETQD
jgi:hypothetical protein